MIPIPDDEDFAIDWNADCFLLLQRKTVEHRGKKGSWVELSDDEKYDKWTNNGKYFGKFGHMLSEYFKRRIMRTNPQSMDELIECIRKCNASIEKLGEVFPSQMRPAAVKAQPK